jgi:hypothetical protein
MQFSLNFRSVFFVSALLLIGSFVASCASKEDAAAALKTVQRKDKNLSCKEVLLEMNEADFYKKMALRNRGPKLKYILMPLGYISTYMEAEEAIAAAEARGAYLEKIYDIMHCANQENSDSPAATSATIETPMAPVVAPNAAVPAYPSAYTTYPQAQQSLTPAPLAAPNYASPYQQAPAAPSQPAPPAQYYPSYQLPTDPAAAPPMR